MIFHLKFLEQKTFNFYLFYRLSYRFRSVFVTTLVLLKTTSTPLGEVRVKTFASWTKLSVQKGQYPLL